MKYFVLFLAFIASSSVQAQPQPADTSDWTETEHKVHQLISQDGIYVVHFWATWCHNSRSELKRGIWPRIINRNPDTEFIFVTIRDEGKTGTDVLAEYNIPEQVTILGQEEIGRSQNQRNRLFMNLPSYWTPTTWVFHKNGKLAYAINHGEVNEKAFQQLLKDLRKNWSH
ncbi:MAG: thioredoxin [Balneolaceae bacterium]|nr:thioredoxin [Balneolaceae bacterium]